MISITKEFSFEAAHRLSNHPAACKHIHGHSYRLFVTVSAQEIQEDDMIIDFKELKQIVDEKVLKTFDHALVLKKNDENARISREIKSTIFWMENEPTVERLLDYIRKQVQDALPTPVFLKKLKLHETASSFGEWEK
ncbi:6-carboxytetrahydropterin synthase QueD [Marivirga harenae]|uniref:6-carboxytetrahydropterin synthase QueD n=1 Tax=Marivirga harenae TaxID=2010992 RepID=UPI0026E04D30|nr:6-carboxytetrahydropterin synthase QueD [Marivirga harenae]WKV12959.1 6-carboxytetrahydropterin synthase QueD [Marivirga harenae]|tara:strand:+ start:78334 stop:78744 length:411 start_codon:yes stop_codon:yes gene_type:complete